MKIRFSRHVKIEPAGAQRPPDGKCDPDVAAKATPSRQTFSGPSQKAVWL